MPFDVQTWSPTKLGVVDDAYLERLAVLYRGDNALHGRFEAALQQQDMVGEEPMAGSGARRGGITPLMQAAAHILRQEARTEHRGRWSSAAGTRTRTRDWPAARSIGCSDSSPRA